jgi:glucosamine-6-phosphate deaminase
METDVIPQHLSQEKILTRIFPNSLQASKVVAKEIADLIMAAKQKGRNAVLGLATGSTPKKVYAELIRLHTEEGLSFKNVVSFNLDEYYPLPNDAQQSYRHYMHENLFRHIDILPENCNIPDGTVEQERLEEYCEEFERKIEAAGGMDFQLLGIGSNGHIGFNEPGSPVESRTRLITLDLSTCADAASDFGGIANVPKKAITMGVSTILKAKRIVMLVWGRPKTNIIKKAIEGPVTEVVPASYLQGHLNAIVVMDKDASAELTGRKLLQ